MERKDAFDADAASGDAANGEVGGGATAVLPPNYHALEGLYPDPVALTNSEINPYRVSGTEVRKFGCLLRFDQLGRVHIES